MATIESIEGIGPAHGSTLRAHGVRTTQGLLGRGATRKGRRELAAASGIKEATILEWVNRADLMRVRGVATQYADLLEAAGVDTVKELAHRRPDNLAAKMAEVNGAKHLVRSVPSAKVVAKWVEAAGGMDSVVQY